MDAGQWQSQYSRLGHEQSHVSPTPLRIQLKETILVMTRELGCCAWGECAKFTLCQITVNTYMTTSIYITTREAPKSRVEIKIKQQRTRRLDRLHLDGGACGSNQEPEHLRCSSSRNRQFDWLRRRFPQSIACRITTPLCALYMSEHTHISRGMQNG